MQVHTTRDGIKVIDFTHDADQIIGRGGARKWWRRRRFKAGAGGLPRSAAKVYQCWHRFYGGDRPISPSRGWTLRQHLKIAGLDPRETWPRTHRLASRMLTFPYHGIACDMDGIPLVVLTWPEDWWMWHANDLNSRSVGLCWAGGPMVTDAGARAIHHLASRFSHMPAVTHRQSSKRRGADPGEQVIEALAPGARRPCPDLVWGSGRPWPKSWLDAWARGRSLLL